MTIAAGTLVTTAAGRPGVAVYDNALVTNDTHDSVIVIYNDSTYTQESRAALTTGAAGFLPGTGPGN